MLWEPGGEIPPGHPTTRSLGGVLRESGHREQAGATLTGCYDDLVSAGVRTRTAAALLAIREQADQRARHLAGIVATARANGCVSYREIADELNRQAIATARSGRWHAATVRRLERRRWI